MTTVVLASPVAAAAVVAPPSPPSCSSNNNSSTLTPTAASVVDASVAAKHKQYAHDDNDDNHIDDDSSSSSSSSASLMLEPEAEDKENNSLNNSLNTLDDAGSTSAATNPIAPLDVRYKKRPRVSFESADIVEFEPTLYTTTVTSGGIPVGMSFTERSRSRRRLDSWELERTDARIGRQSYMEEGYLDPLERESILHQTGSFDDSTIVRVEAEVNQIIANRRESNEVDFEFLYGLGDDDDVDGNNDDDAEDDDEAIDLFCTSQMTVDDDAINHDENDDDAIDATGEKSSNSSDDAALHSEIDDDRTAA